jgi:hypothetical protein
MLPLSQSVNALANEGKREGDSKCQNVCGLLVCWFAGVFVCVARFGFFRVIEHNNEDVKRKGVTDLLEKHGKHFRRPQW